MSTQLRFKQLKTIVFSLLSPEDLRKLSVINIRTPDTYDEDGTPIDIGLVSRRLGTIEPGQRCQVCGNRVGECPGHFGHIELTRPVVHVGFVKLIQQILQATCPKCGRISIPQEDIDRLKMLKEKKARLWELIKQRTMDRLLKKAVKETECPHCRSLKGKIKLEKPTNFYEKTKEGERRLFPVEIRARLELIPDEDCELLGLNPKLARPEWMVLTVLFVPPMAVRPSITLESGIRSEDDLTHKLVDIVRINERLREQVELGAPMAVIEELWDLLQYHVTTYFDNEVSGIPPARQRSGRALRTLIQRLRGKEGRFRSSLSGKRVNFSARTVISPDPNLSINEVGVPIEVAKILTMPERVTELNLKEMKELVLKGPYEHPGANYIIRPDGRRVDLRYVKDRSVAAEALSLDFIVERHIRDGDVVLLNRQPSLHRPSIMAHLVKVLPYKTFRLNLSVCPPYNADFDGDEMNLHIPQSEEARSEAFMLALVQEQMLSPRYGGPIVGGVQDHTSGAYILTQKFTLFSSEEVQNLVFKAGYEGELPEPAILKPGPYWTGKQLFSLLLPKGLNCSLKSNACLKCDVCLKEDCPNDAFVLVLNGELLMGLADKKSIGAQQPESILHRIIKDYGTKKGRLFIDNAFKLFLAFISDYGLSMGLSDEELPLEVKLRIHDVLEQEKRRVVEIIDTYERSELEPTPGQTLEETLEMRVHEVLAEARDKAGEIASRYLDPRSHTLIMARAGSRGSILNLTQLTACLGQQTVRGERIHRGYTDRTLPHFLPGDKGATSRGFVIHSFKEGLSPTEFFFHAMGGREGLVDTAVRTSQSGYLQRRLINALQDIRVEYDQTVRDALGRIVQFKYGEDGVDPAKSDHGKPVNIDKILEKVLGPKAVVKMVTLTKEEVRAELDKIAEEGRLPPSLIKDLERRLPAYELTREELKKILEETIKAYENTLVEPGEAVGTVCAQSIGEPATQMTLRTFHYAGVRELNVTLGLPRLIEVLDARRIPSTPIMAIYLGGEARYDREKATEVANKLTETTVENVAKSIDYDFLHQYVVIKLDSEILKDRQITTGEVARALEAHRVGHVEETEDTITIKLSGTFDFNEFPKLRQKVLGVRIKGVKGLKRPVIKKEGEEWVIYFDGSNLAGVLKKAEEVLEIDLTRVYTNNVHEIANILGIEAARNSIVNETVKVLEEQGLDVDIRHVMLVADLMTATGRIRQIGRHGISGEKGSVLARAAFEMTTKQLLEAGVRGERDDLKGVAENVIVGQIIPLGSGLVDILMRYIGGEGAQQPS